MPSKRPKRVAKRREVLPLAALLAITFVAYANSFWIGLAQDSKVIINEDPRIRALTAENLKRILDKDYWWPRPGVDRLYRPVTTASLLVNYAVLGNGTDATGYHLVNFLLHALNVWLVYQLAWILFEQTALAWFAAAVWAVQPIGTEAVTNIVGRADLLAAMAILGGLLLYVRFTRSTTPGLFAIAVVGVFAKESAAVLIGLMLLWDLSFGIGEPRVGIRRRLPAYAAVAASLLLMALVRWRVLSSLPWPHEAATDNLLRTAGFWTARLTAIKVIGLDLWLLLFPLELSSDHGFHQIALSGWSDIGAWAALLGVCAILAYAVARRRHDPVLFLLAGFFGITLLPTSNLVVLISSMMAERFLYLPSVAFALALAMLAFRYLPRHAPAVLAVLLVLYTGRTMIRNPDWNDNLTLASADVATAPRSFRLHIMLANALFQQDAQRDLDRAIQEAERAWAILSPLPAVQSTEIPPANLGMYYALKARSLGIQLTPQTRPWYEKSLAVLVCAREISQATEKAFDQVQLAHGKPLPPRGAYQRLYFSLASDYHQLGRYAEAIEALLYGRNIQPETLETYGYLASVYSAAGQPARAAIALLEQGLLDGLQPATLVAIRRAYQAVDGGDCALREAAGIWSLNPDCPALRRDLCLASADLAAAFLAARQPVPARQLPDASRERYGCAVAGT